MRISDWSSDVCSSDLLDALYGWGFGADRPHTNFDPLIGLNNAFGDMLLNFVMAMMFIVLPTFWVMALAWAGVRTGNIVQGLSTATSAVKGAGGRVAGMAMSAVSKKCTQFSRRRSHGGRCATRSFNNAGSR